MSVPVSSSRPGLERMMFLPALPSPMKFPLDEIKEFSRGRWSTYLLDLVE